MNEIIKKENIQGRIFTIRGLQVMVDRDLAELYAVSTKRLNEQVKRNSKRFPESFRFQLSDKEKKELVANCDRFEKLKHSSVNPYAFTEQGVAMLSAVLHSDIAIEVSIRIMEAFSQMRKFILTNATLFQRIEQIEKKQLIADEKFDRIFKALEDKSFSPKQGVFYNGQIFDAYTLIADIIRSAQKEIILIDNYVDDTVLKQLSKRKKNVRSVIYTKTLNKIFKQDLEKNNAQYPKIEVKKLTTAHDRFLIIDAETVYHFGASLKDAGKKWLGI